MVKKKFLRHFWCKSALIVAWGQVLWAQRAAPLLYDAGGYMLSVEGGGDTQGVLDHKCLLQISTCKTTFARFLWCLSFSLVLTISGMYRQS